MEMAKRLVAVEVKVDHLSEKIDTANNTIESHSTKTNKILMDMGSKIDNQGITLSRITLWMEAAPKIIKVGLGVVLAATLLSSNGWKVVFDLVLSLMK